MSALTKRRINSGIRYTILVIVGVALIYPLIWMIGSSFKWNLDIFGNLNIFPPVGAWTFDHYPNAWQLSMTNNMAFYYMNTLRFLIPRVIGTVISCTIAAFAISRFNFKGKKIILTTVMVTLLMPELAFRIPIFMFYNEIGLMNTFASLYLHDFFGVNSFFVFMIIQFMRTIPKELDEAAAIDGAGPIRTLISVMVPALRPILITVGLLTFMWGMNDFQGPLIFLRMPEYRVLALALRGLIDDYAVTQFGVLFAAAFMALIPTLVIFFSCSRYFVDSVTSSGMKE